MENENNLNSDFAAFQINKKIQEEIDAIIQKYPEYSFINKNRQDLKDIQEIIDKLRAREQQSDEEQLPTHFHKIYFFYRIKIVERFIQFIHKAVNSGPFYIITQQTCLLLSATIPGCVQALSSCEIASTQKATILGESLIAKYKSVTREFQKALTTHHQHAYERFYDFTKLSTEKKSNEIRIYQDKDNCAINYPSDEMIDRFIAAELFPFINQNYSRKHIIINLTALPADTVIADIGWINNQLILTLISFNQFNSLSVFIGHLIKKMLETYPEIEFKIALCQSQNTSSEIHATPQKCLALCRKLSNIDLPKIVYDLQNQIISKDIEVKIIVPSVIYMKAPYAEQKAFVMTQDVTPFLDKITCLNFDAITREPMISELKSYLLSSSTQLSDTEEEILDKTESVSEEDEVDDENDVFLAMEEQSSPIKLFEKRAKEILDSNNTAYTAIKKILEGIEQACIDKTPDSFDMGYVFLSRYNKAITAIKTLISASNGATADNFYLYNYFIYRYVNAFFNCVKLIAENLNHEKNDKNIDRVCEHTERVTELLIAFEKNETKITISQDDDVLNSIMTLLQTFIEALPVRLNTLFRLKYSEYLTCDEIATDLRRDLYSSILCFKNNKSENVSRPYTEFSEDFLKEILPLQQQESFFKQFLIFPLQQPHYCFLLKLFKIEDKLQIIFISAFHFEFQSIFLAELAAILKNNKIPFEIYTCQRDFKQNLALTPVFLAHIAKSNKVDSTALFPLLKYNFIPEKNAKKITDKQFNSETSFTKSINPALFIPDIISTAPIQIPAELNPIINKVNTSEYLKDIFSFKHPVNIETFKKAISYAIKIEFFNPEIQQSSITIARKKRLFDHAIALEQAITPNEKPKSESENIPKTESVEKTHKKKKKKKPKKKNIEKQTEQSQDVEENKSNENNSQNNNSSPKVKDEEEELISLMRNQKIDLSKRAKITFITSMNSFKSNTKTNVDIESDDDEQESNNNNVSASTYPQN